MTEEIYNPGQAKVLFDVWPNRQVDWFVIGGPADGNEAQTIRAKFPDVQCIGFEPCERMRARQLELQFPGDLHPYALWNETKEMELSDPRAEDGGPRGAGLIREYSDDVANKYTVNSFTLDDLSDKFGPWKNCVLWLDIERAEKQALEGASKLLASGDVLLINVEVMEMSRRLPLTEDLLKGYGYELVKTWNPAMADMCDAVFRLKGI